MPQIEKEEKKDPEEKDAVIRRKSGAALNDSKRKKISLRFFIVPLALIILICASLAVYFAGPIDYYLLEGGISNFFPSFNNPDTDSAVPAFNLDLKGKGMLRETGKISESPNDFWWVNSGGLMKVRKDKGHPNFGRLSSSNRWHKLYAKTNPKDTDGGDRPQNIFRLVSRGSWQNFTQQAYFRIRKINRSKSDNRNESNGVLLFNRYQDGDDLYYAGLRVDGRAVIKKKVGGDYYTIADKKIYGKSKKYNRDKKSTSNFLPVNSWFGIKTEVRNIDDGTVEIKLFIDQGKKGNWQLALDVTDDGSEYGGDAIMDSGHGGIRTDFMDVEFKNYDIAEM